MTTVRRLGLFSEALTVEDEGPVDAEKGWETLRSLVDSLPKGPMLGANAKGECHPAFVINHGFLVKLLDVLAYAFEQSGLTEEEWNALPEVERYNRVDRYVDRWPPK